MLLVLPWCQAMDALLSWWASDGLLLVRERARRRGEAIKASLLVALGEVSYLHIAAGSSATICK